MLQRLNHLPRDARDTLFLLGVIAWVILPQIDRLPLWCSLMAGAVLLNEALHWQDWAAVALIMLAIATVLWPARPVAQSSG